MNGESRRDSGSHVSTNNHITIKVIKKWIIYSDWKKSKMDNTFLNRIFWEAKIAELYFILTLTFLKPGLMINGNYKCAKDQMKKPQLGQY